MTKDKFYIIKLIILQALCGALAILIGGILSVSSTFEYYHTRLYKNISINNIDVGNLTAEEANTCVNNTYLKPLLDKKFILTFDDSTLQLSLSNLLIETNLTTAIEEALSYPITLSTWEKIALLQGTTSRNFQCVPIFNKEHLRQVATDLINSKVTSSKNAAISITSDGTITLIPHEVTITFNQTALYEALDTYLEDYQDLEATTTIDLNSFVSISSPSITTDTLKSIDTCVSSYRTIFTPQTGNATNITICARTINNTLLMPGDTFSFNDLVGNTTLDKGYTYAPVIANSKMVQGVGGGVCQVSSTLYNAILQIGILPTERSPHSIPSSYVPLGLDATINWDTIDFKFKNTLDYPIYIVAYTEKNELIIDLYSNHTLKDTTYVLRSEIYGEIPSSTRYITDSSLSKDARLLVSRGYKGYRVKTIRETYRNNKLIESRIISWDTYAAKPTTYKIGR